jgi:hypothetical protein
VLLEQEAGHAADAGEKQDGDRRLGRRVPLDASIGFERQTGRRRILPPGVRGTLGTTSIFTGTFQDDSSRAQYAIKSAGSNVARDASCTATSAYGTSPR